jgi:uncharacterized protein (DUF433 family)
VQDATGLDAEFCLVAVVRGQYMLTPAADLFYKRSPGKAIRKRPGDLTMTHSPVIIRPGGRAGWPVVKGIGTEILWEHSEAGETADDIAAEFGLSNDDVRWALAPRSRTSCP